MSTEDQNQDFEKLQRLLKLKRHELPPPRFFNDFSGKVTDRIRAGDVGRLETFADVVGQTPWLQRIWQAIEGKPAVSGAFAAAVCGLLLAGVFLSDKTSNTLPTFAESVSPVPDPQPVLFATSPGMPVLANSTQPTAMLSNSLFALPYFEGAPQQASGRSILSDPK